MYKTNFIPKFKKQNQKIKRTFLLYLKSYRGSVSFLICNLVWFLFVLKALDLRFLYILISAKTQIKVVAHIQRFHVSIHSKSGRQMENSINMWSTGFFPITQRTVDDFNAIRVTIKCIIITRDNGLSIFFETRSSLIF